MTVKTITLTLAHPLDDPTQLTYLGLDPQTPLAVGSTIEVNRNAARSLINAGYAEGVNPTSAASVAKALQIDVGQVQVDDPRGTVVAADGPKVTPGPATKEK